MYDYSWAGTLNTHANDEIMALYNQTSNLGVSFDVTNDKKFVLKLCPEGNDFLRQLLLWKSLWNKYINYQYGLHCEIIVQDNKQFSYNRRFYSLFCNTLYAPEFNFWIYAYLILFISLNSSGLYAHKITDDISQDCKFMKHLKRPLVLHGPFKDTIRCAPKSQLYAYTDRANVSNIGTCLCLLVSL